MMTAACFFTSAATPRSIVLGDKLVEEVTEKPDLADFVDARNAHELVNSRCATGLDFATPSRGHSRGR